MCGSSRGLVSRHGEFVGNAELTTKYLTDSYIIITSRDDSIFPEVSRKYLRGDEMGKTMFLRACRALFRLMTIVTEEVWHAPKSKRKRLGGHQSC